VEFVVDKVALGQVFSECFGFSCQSLFHQFLHNHHHLSSGAGTIGQQWPQYPKSHRTNCNKKNILGGVGIAKSVKGDGLWAGRLEFDSRNRQKKFSIPESVHKEFWAHPASYPTGALSAGVKKTGSEADHSTPPNTEIKKAGATPPLPHMASWHCA
jgi:hypothetical protein